MRKAIDAAAPGLIAAAIVVALFTTFLGRADAQTGMSKATAKLLVTDLIEAGHAPQIREQGGAYFVVVRIPLSNVEQAATAAQVNSFANSRGVTAKVLEVQFE